MSYVLGLKCKECGHRVPVSAVHVCEQCFGPYEVEYDYAAMRGKVTRESIAAGPKSLWRYRDLLPVDVPRGARDRGGLQLRPTAGSAWCQGKRVGHRDLFAGRQIFRQHQIDGDSHSVAHG